MLAPFGVRYDTALCTFMERNDWLKPFVRRSGLAWTNTWNGEGTYFVRPLHEQLDLGTVSTFMIVSQFRLTKLIDVHLID